MTKSIYDVLDEYRALALDKRNQGDLFEYLIQSFLRTAPLYQQRFSDVWLWRDYPGRNGRADTGIDLVAKDRETGDLTAIQCKFYDAGHVISKAEVDGFLAASGKHGEFAARLFVSTTDHWGKNAQETIEGQHPPVMRLGVHDLGDSGVDWSTYSFDRPTELQPDAKKKLRPYQSEAIAAVRAGLTEGERGKLIMACGTGKTFTSLRAMEDVVPEGGRVLFLVPSIALLSQTLKEWTAAAESPIRAFAVCSDVRVGKRSRDDDAADLTLTDLAYPATTDATGLAAQFSKRLGAGKTTVVFSTYQSIGVIHEAQQQGVPDFDLIICDEAHRTTGVTLADEEESHFVKVHDAEYIRGSKRLYMTATPRIYGSEAKKVQADGAAVLASMDDESLYGPELYRLGFGEAVAGRWLTDYKVIVLAVDERQVSRSMQRVLATSEHEIDLPDAAKIVGCWNGLAKRSDDPEDFGRDRAPMQRAVAFTRSIRDSKQFAEQFEEIAGELASDDRPPRCEVQHVDGGMNILERNGRLDWLREGGKPGECRILSNAKCLSEGVDVPALDAVLFLNPRNSIVDVVQSVGRVMRLSAGKEYGYVILPVAVPTDQEPDVALNDNKRFEVVWKVLQALRAHDERLDATINKLDLNRDKRANGQISIIGVNTDSRAADAWAGDSAPVRLGEWDSDGVPVTLGAEAAQAAAVRVQSSQLAFPGFEQWEDAFYARIVKKVGTRRYWEDWAKDIGEIAQRQITRITDLVEGSDHELRQQFTRFHKGLQDNLNPSVKRDDAIEMLAQHLITQPVFDALFAHEDFSRKNPVAQVMQGMLDALEGKNLGAETKTLEKFYDDVRIRAEGLDNAAAKQHVVKELYEKFFSHAFSRTSDRLGIVYTPIEIVDFILRSVDDALYAEFGSRITDEGVHVLDPFTGTGTFIVRLLQSGLIAPDELPRKYRHELHANELVLLAYYVAAVNIEETYQSLRGGNHVPFDGIVLTDTFQMTEDGDELDGRGVFPVNNERVQAQLERPIRVIVGNPPYSKGQDSGNDDNQNLKYPTLDKRIADTYAKRSTGTNKNSLYDSYIRAIRWASDRIGDQGIVAYVSNGGFIDGNTADGLRKTLQDEFSSLYIFNLRGNQRTAGEQSRKEGGKVFGGGSRATIAIYLLVKNPQQRNGGVFYRDIGDYLSREEKLETIAKAGSFAALDWRRVEPNDEGDWLGQRSPEFESYTPIGSKDPADKHRARFLELYSRGLATARDAWVYNYSAPALEANVRRMVEFYNAQVDAALGGGPQDRVVDASRISWGAGLQSLLERGIRIQVEQHRSATATYRPFSKTHLHFEPRLLERTYQMTKLYPTPESKNWGFVLTSPASHYPTFEVLAVDTVPDLHSLDTGQFFPRYRFEPIDHDLLAGLEPADSGYRRIDNVTDEILAEYQATFGKGVTKDDIFHYLYGILHSPDYRARFKTDLKKMLPRIPKVRAFREFASAGAELARLHIGYETATPHPVAIDRREGASLRVEKMRYGKTGGQVDKSIIVYNNGITVRGIPLEAQEYMLGARSALDWILERYQVKTDKRSGIVNDPNAWGEEHGDPRYILDLIGRITTVSLETVRIVRSLPELDVVR
ncbi:type ISP restriction/modification enzyme [Agrococcus sp. HG114]|uniref:DEAD/DEAH box helicase n=1 Tax=Agrococcus sp. HG114 TaxID=2969757 RepID=UPI00215B0073|nr:type ISP restriction/modification enzyme [Agrococcus sp. HG114]MCR8669582.1 DEAD/DEAH box helicase family protein [Agrococcus sp. HG114]